MGLANVSGEAAMRAFTFIIFSFFWPSLNRPPGRLGFLRYLHFKYLPGASRAVLNPINISLLVLSPRCGSLESCPKRGEDGPLLCCRGWRPGGQEAGHPATPRTANWECRERGNAIPGPGDWGWGGGGDATPGPAGRSWSLCLAYLGPLPCFLVHPIPL